MKNEQIMSVLKIISYTVKKSECGVSSLQVYQLYTQKKGHVLSRWVKSTTKKEQKDRILLHCLVSLGESIIQKSAEYNVLYPWEDKLYRKGEKTGDNILYPSEYQLYRKRIEN